MSIQPYFRNKVLNTLSCNNRLKESEPNMAHKDRSVVVPPLSPACLPHVTDNGVPISFCHSFKRAAQSWHSSKENPKNKK